MIPKKKLQKKINYVNKRFPGSYLCQTHAWLSDYSSISIPGAKSSHGLEIKTQVQGQVIKIQLKVGEGEEPRFKYDFD